MAKSPPPRQTSSKVSTLASKVLSGSVNPTKAQAKTFAASALGQDQTKSLSGIMMFSDRAFGS